jgi:hypothetical protein
MIKSRFSKKRTQLRRALLQAAESMIQAGLSRTTRTCSSPGCGCHSDPRRRHGPHTYLTFRDAAGTSSSLYVAPEHEAEARAAKAAWDRFGAAAVALAVANRAELRRRWQGTPKTRATRGSFPGTRSARSTRESTGR